MALVDVDLTPRIGSELKVDKKTLLDGTASGEIRAILEQRGVILIRGIEFSDSEQLAFAGTLGNIRDEFGHKIMAITPDKTINPAYAEFFDANVFWHLDGAWEDVPPLASILVPRVIAPTGGETEFANVYAAYDDLSDADKALIEDLEVVHTMEAAVGRAIANPTEEQLTTWRNYPTKVHPLVWHHRTGRKSLALSSTVSHVQGMERTESDALLARLVAFATQPQYVYQHKWRMGDLLMWDNTGTLHRVQPFDKASGRRLERVTLLGEESLDRLQVEPAE